MTSINNNPFGFNSQAMADRQKTIAQGQLDYQKQSDTEVKTQETEASGGAVQALGKGIQGAKALKDKVQGGADKISTLAQRLDERFQGVSDQLGSRGNAIPGLVNHLKPTSSTSITSTRAMGDMDSITHPGSSLLAGADNGRNLPKLDNVVKASRSLGNDVESSGLTQGVRTLGQTISTTASNIHQSVNEGVSLTGRMAQNTATRMGDAVRPLAQGLEKGIGLAEGVADALGPVGDIVGLGMAIFGGVKAREERKEEKQGEVQQQATINALPKTNTTDSSAVSVSAPAQKPMAQMSQSQSHY